MIYLSGKITGLSDLNKPKFRSAEGLIRKTINMAGYSVWTCNPHDLPDDHHDKSWYSYMRECLKALCVCSRIYVLDDWKDSKGAIVEVLVAKILNIPMYEVETMQKFRISYCNLFVRLLLKLK